MPEVCTVWRVVRVDHVTYVTPSLTTLFGGRLRKQRFQLAMSRLDCTEVTVKDPTEHAGSLVVREAFSVGRNRPGHIRRIPHPDDRNFRRAAAEKASDNKRVKYIDLVTTHTFAPIAVETSGACCSQSARFVEDLGRRITAVTNESLETAYLYQRLSVSRQQGNAVAFNNTFPETYFFTAVDNLVR